MIKTAASLIGAILAVAIAPASADSYPDSFADYLNAQGLYFNYLSAAEESFWFKTSAGDIVLRLPSAVAPKVSVVSAEEPPSDAEVARIRSDVELAMSSALDRLGIRRCSSGVAGDQAKCIPFALQIGFSARHGDVVYMPDFRDSRGRRIGGLANGYFGSHGKLYGMGCGTRAETSAAGEVAGLDAAFTFEVIGASDVLLPQPQKPLASGMEDCLLGLLGVSVPQDLPREDVGYYVAASLETLRKAETYLTRDQIANDIPELVMTHALRKALGKEPTIGQ